MMTETGRDETPKTLSIIMPAYNAEDLLPKVLAPLMDMYRAGEVAEVIVVDDCSTDGSKQVAESLGATVLSTPHNGGPGLARNVGTERATGDVVWFVDSDVIIHPHSAHLVLDAFRDPSVSAIFGSYDETPPATNFASQYKNLIHTYYHQRGKREASTFWSGCGAVRRADFLAVDGFDAKRYAKPSIEDIELGYRLRAKGGRIVLIHDLRGTHLKAWTLKSVVMTDIFKRAMPWSRLMLQGFGLTDDLNVSQGERIRAGIAGLMFLSLFAALLDVSLMWLPLVLFGVAIAANWSLFQFFQRKRGLTFALLGLLFHQVYYVYSAVVFVWCALEFRLKRFLGGKPASAD